MVPNPLIQQLMELPIEIHVWLLICLAVFLLIKLERPRRRHARTIGEAQRALSKLRVIDCPAKQLSYLRKVNWFVYEEMILTALQDAGHSIVRNHRYTGDGGIDGRATINGRRFLIQAKRLSGHVNAKHVSDLSALCDKNNVFGLFVHTGRTGKQSRINSQTGRIDIVSGNRMLDLLIGKPFIPRFPHGTANDEATGSSRR